MPVRTGETYWRKEGERFLFAKLQKSTGKLQSDRNTVRRARRQKGRQILHAGSTCSGTIMFCRVCLCGSLFNHACVTPACYSHYSWHVMETTNSQLWWYSDLWKVQKYVTFSFCIKRLSVMRHFASVAEKKNNIPSQVNIFNAPFRSSLSSWGARLWDLICETVWKSTRRGWQRRRRAREEMGQE